MVSVLGYRPPRELYCIVFRHMPKCTSVSKGPLRQVCRVHSAGGTMSQRKPLTEPRLSPRPRCSSFRVLRLPHTFQHAPSHPPSRTNSYSATGRREKTRTMTEENCQLPYSRRMLLVLFVRACIDSPLRLSSPETRRKVGERPEGDANRDRLSPGRGGRQWQRAILASD